MKTKKTHTIEKDVPLPKKARGPKERYPFEVMEVGDSFYVKTKRGTSLYTLSSRHSKDGKKFTCRRVDDGFRIWRIS